MKVTRRSLARVLTISAAVPLRLAAQSPPAAASSSDVAVRDAREEFRESGRVLAAVKLPRSVEPATRFEA